MARQPGKRGTYTEARKAKFLEALALGATVTRAATAAGWGRRTAYTFRRSRPDFAEEWDDAVEQGTDMLEERARELAFDGIIHKRPIVAHGEIIGYEERVEVQPRLAELLLKSRHNRFRDKQALEITGSTDHRVTVEAGTSVRELVETISVFERLGEMPPGAAAALARVLSVSEGVPALPPVIDGVARVTEEQVIAAVVGQGGDDDDDGE